MQLAGGSTGVKLLSATTTGNPLDNIYEFIRMEPDHALIGPGDTVGFAFRTAVLDLSGTAGPSGVPATARAMPGDWQGLYLPEVRLFVAPNGVEGLAVSAGVRDLWIGIGVHEGVTGIFEAEVVNRGGTPAITRPVPHERPASTSPTRASGTRSCPSTRRCSSTPPAGSRRSRSRSTSTA